MKTIFRQIPLYRFLYYCNQSALEKNVLDCGAGGNCPPLALFLEHGYQTFGIEIDARQIKKAQHFADKRGLNLNIVQGDMKCLPFENESMSFIYSYNSIFHMSKKDLRCSIQEMKRVLKPQGLIYVNLLSTQDQGFGVGEKVNCGEYVVYDEGRPYLHTYFEKYEADAFFVDMETLYQEVRVVDRLYGDERIQQGFIDYIVRKS